MSTPDLRPPLPAPLSHDGIVFTLDMGNHSEGRLSERLLVAIASTLQAILPDGDLTVGADGTVVVVGGATHTATHPSLWYQSGLLAGIERSLL